jgi:hypothetical protein
MGKNFYTSGEWNVICDVCSKKIKAAEAKHRWDGFIVCPEDFETRHSQDFVRAKQDKITVEFVRPIPDELSTNVTYITMYCQGGYLEPYDTYIQDPSL